jgi:hypothetical protein
MARATELERRLERQQKSLAESQQELDTALRQQASRLRTREGQQQKQVEQEKQRRAIQIRRAASLPRQTWRKLGLLPLTFLLIGLFGLSRTGAVLIGAALLTIQILAFLRDRANWRDDIET